MTEVLKGKSFGEFKTLFDGFQHMVTADLSEAPDEEKLGKLAVLSGVREFPSRIKCAILCWHTMKSAVEGAHEVAKTE
jgi:nitrogen fixation NifU-like protein